MTHDELMKEIRDYCTVVGVVAEHFPNAHGCWVKGFPDLVIVGPAGILYREVKTASARLEPAQWEWSWWLMRTGANWAVWRPIHWPEFIKEELDQLAKV